MAPSSFRSARRIRGTLPASGAISSSARTRRSGLHRRRRGQRARRRRRDRAARAPVARALRGAARRAAVGARREPSASARFRRRPPFARVAEPLRRRPWLPAVVDPVFARKPRRRARRSAARYALARRARDALERRAHAESRRSRASAGTSQRSSASRLADAAAQLRARGAGAVLLKGGHLGGDPADALATEDGVEIFSEPRIAGAMHGTGCTLAMALACELADGTPLAQAVRRGAGLRSRADRKALTARSNIDARMTHCHAKRARDVRHAADRRAASRAPRRRAHAMGDATRENADAFFEIADLHAYTTDFEDPAKIRGARKRWSRSWLAAGVDPAEFHDLSAVRRPGDLRAASAARR